jgi:hypothetical protein
MRSSAEGKRTKKQTKNKKLDLVEHNCNPQTQDTEASWKIMSSSPAWAIEQQKELKEC